MIETGTQIGEYRIDGLLGQGGMAEVYKVWHTGLHRHEALKMPLIAGQGPDFVQRFLGEARTVAGLQHHNIAAIYSVSDANETQPYFTMEMVEGGDLADLISNRGRLPLDEALSILRQIASALDFAHSRGLIHRDIKPANILLKPEADGYTVKVVDFGISRAVEETEGARLTKTGMFIGTPEYMSPEQAGNGDVVDQRTDQYSLAVLAYEMLCGVPPFKSEANTSMLSVVMKHVRDEPLPPSRYNLSLPASVDVAILRALAKHPAQRFHSCGQFVDALVARESVIIPDTNGTSTNIGAKSTFPAAAVIVILAVVIGAALIIGGMMNSHHNGTNDGGEDVAQSQIVPSSQNSMPDAGKQKQFHPPKPKPSNERISWPSPGAPQYVVPLVEQNLRGKSPHELDFMRNSIYARYGRAFKRQDLRDYFNSQSWYHHNPNFRESLLSSMERRNAAFILQYQKNTGLLNSN